MCDENAVCREVGPAGQDDVCPLVERPADVLERRPAHHDRLAQAQPAEALQVRRQPPRDARLVAEHQVAVHRRQERDDHTATSPGSRPWL
jgi:hypothetical protein